MDKYEPILNHISEKKPPQRLLTAILERISRLEDRRARRQFAWGITGMAISAIGLWYGALYAIAELKTSGFYQYISILISDSDALGGFWKEFIFAITESFPLMSTIIILSMLVLLLGSLQSTIRGTRKGKALLFTRS